MNTLPAMGDAGEADHLAQQVLGEGPPGPAAASVNVTINQTGQAIENILIIMAAYLSISLSISLFMNWYNKRIALTER